MGKKGHISRAGNGEIYEEPKSARILIILTPTALATVDATARALRLSRSEIIEQLIRGKIRSEIFISKTPDDQIIFITLRVNP